MAEESNAVSQVTSGQDQKLTVAKGCLGCAVLSVGVASLLVLIAGISWAVRTPTRAPSAQPPAASVGAQANLPDPPAALMPWLGCTKLVKARLKNPDRATFTVVFERKLETLVKPLGGGKFHCEGWVDSIETPGEMQRTSFGLTVHETPDGYELVDFDRFIGWPLVPAPK